MKKMHVAVMSILLLASALTTTADAVAREARLAIVPFHVHAAEDLEYIQSGLGALLPPRISLPGKISVLDPGAVRQALTEKSAGHTLDEEVALARTLGADFVLTGSLTKIGEIVSIDALVIDVTAPDTSTPVSVQSNGFETLIPEIQALARQVQQRILDGPPQPVRTLETAPPARMTAAAQPPAAAAPSVAEEPLHETPPPARETARTPPAADFDPARPVFAPTPSAGHEIIHPPFICLAAGDTTGDSRVELLVADPSVVRVYKVTHSALELRASIPTKTGETIVYVEMFDLNGNGRGEIYVSSHGDRGANSFVVEYSDGEYRRVAESLPWFFHSYTLPGGSAALLGHTPGTESAFAGVVHRFAWKNGELIEREEVPLPGGVALFGSAWGDITGDGRLESVSFSKGFLSARYHLKVFSQTGRLKWNDPHDLGGSANSIVRFKVGTSLEQTEYIPLRVYCEDLNRDSRTDIIVARNSKKGRGFLRRLATYNQGEMVCLHWDGSDLVTNWSSGTMEGYISDYLLTDIDGDGIKDLVVLSVSHQGFFGKAANSVRIFKQAP
jgi:TolB-like protein